MNIISNKIFQNKKYSIVTLGCFRNDVESDLIRSELARMGMSECPSVEESDIIIVNTCGFITPACEDTIDAILETHELTHDLPKKPQIVAVGCMAQRYQQELLEEMPELSAVVGVNWAHELSEAISRIFQGQRYASNSRNPEPFYPRRDFDSSGGATLFVRISDGCLRNCSFCTIPKLRGKYKSRIPDEICDEIERLSNNQDREVILLAQDATSYGIDLPNNYNLAELISRISRIDHVRWIRLLYLQPEGVTEELLSEIASNRKV
ncbi:MAG: radical SAM protein, partial [Actinomycetota bacterium]|nr:radical SAM protein [Actinomycetota bacterium]